VLAYYGNGLVTVVVPVVCSSTMRLAASVAATIRRSLSSLPQRAGAGSHVETASRGGRASFVPPPVLAGSNALLVPSTTATITTGTVYRMRTFMVIPFVEWTFTVH
jgi:hypothetical protein